MSLSTRLALPLLGASQYNVSTLLNTNYALIENGMGEPLQGLQLVWNSTTSITVKTGLASLANARIITVNADITKSSLSLSASTWYHVYLYWDAALNAGAGGAAAEVVTTAPAVYFGTAHQKSGDATRRYLGSIRTDGSGNVLNFHHEPTTGLVLYRQQIFTAPFQLLTAGVATTRTTVSASAVVTAAARMLIAYVQNTTPNANGYFGNSEDSITTLGSGAGFGVIENGEREEMLIPLNASQAFQYAMSPAPSSGGIYVSARGYYFAR